MLYNLVYHKSLSNDSLESFCKGTSLHTIVNMFKDCK